MSEIADFERSAAFELTDVAERIAELRDTAAGVPLLRRVSRVEDRLAPLYAEARRYHSDALAAGINAALISLDTLKERELDQTCGGTLPA